MKEEILTLINAVLFLLIMFPVSVENIVTLEGKPDIAETPIKGAASRVTFRINNPIITPTYKGDQVATIFIQEMFDLGWRMPDPLAAGRQ